MVKSKKTTFDFHYIKGPDFKTMLASGVYGGVTGNGLIDLNLFIERGPIPKKVTYAIEGKTIGKEIEKESKEGAIREVHTGILLDLNTAKAINKWLAGKIRELEKLQKHE